MGMIEFKREEYREVCEEMKRVLQEEKEMAVKKSELRERLVEMAGGDRMEYGIKVTSRTSAGSVDYKNIVADHLDIDEAVKEHYRRPGRSFWEVRSY